LLFSSFRDRPAPSRASAVRDSLGPTSGGFAASLLEAPPHELPPNAEKKYDRWLERVLSIIERVMEQIQAAADLADDALGA
jgi:hypothetical protein